MIRLKNLIFIEEEVFTKLWKEHYQAQGNAKIEEFMTKECNLTPHKRWIFNYIGLLSDQHPEMQAFYKNKVPEGRYQLVKILVKPKIWITSDLHLGHERVLDEDFDNRPFKNIKEHDSIILKNLVDTLDPKDSLYILGDTFFYSKKDWYKAEEFLKTLQGACNNLYFIKGNHDYGETTDLYEKYGTYLGQQSMITIAKQKWVLNHFPLRVWEESHHGSLHAWGHMHGDIDAIDYGKSKDVWIGGNNWFPYDMEKLGYELSLREIYFIPGDHHIKRQ